MLKKIFIVSVLMLMMQHITAQQGLPVYTDYLTDNYYLIHPSMAGVARCAKVRMTTRKQWLGDDDVPQLATLSINGRLGDKNGKRAPSALGAIMYADKNGFHSQTGAYLTYAHHILLSRNESDLNMVSFGISGGLIQYKLDETSFLSEGFDPLIKGIEQKTAQFNVDLGFSYHILNTYAHITIKNMLANSGINNDIEATTNMRQFLLSVGTMVGKFSGDFKVEPSVLFIYEDGTQESSLDVNLKIHRKMDFGKFWGGVSYRQSFDGAEFLDGSGTSSQKLQLITPIVGINYNKFLFAYNYSYQSNSLVYSNSGFHQITLGLDFNCSKALYHCDCPSVN